MSEASKIIPLKKGEKPDDKMLVTITVAELRAIIRQEIHATGRNDLKAHEWVDIETAAKLMTVSVEWIYHKREVFPSRQRLGAGF